MAYADEKANKGATIGAVVLVHAGLGAALLSGLAVTIFPPVDRPLVTKNVPLVTPPEPPEPTPPEPTARVERPTSPPIDTPVIPEPVVRRTDAIVLTGTTVIPPPPFPIRIEPPTQPVAPTPSVDLSRGLRPRGDQGGWFPQDSYPPAARRAGAEGRVSVAVDVGTDGRVVACRVTSSSGNGDLDGATCRLATRNGRFEPARGADGAPVASTTALRNVRWALE